MRRRIAFGCLAVFLFAGCLLPAGLLAGVGNLGAYYLLRRPVMIRDPAAIEREMDRIEGEIRSLRDISGPPPVQRTMITRDQLREKMTAELEKEYSRDTARNDTATYAAFGVLDPSFDLYSFYLNAYSKYVLGYYDPDSKELYVVSGAGLGPTERSTFAHEYMHGLQFPAHGLTSENWSSGETADIGLGKQALVEGEARYVEDLWQSEYFSIGDKIDYYKQSLASLDLEFFRIPRFLEQMLFYPYSEGEPFIAFLYVRGGWAAVDAAYNRPPVSTEMILHPEKYLEGEQPVAVARPSVPETLPEGWEVASDDAMGEFSIDMILSSRIDTLQASRASAGWGGDRYLLLRNDSNGSTAVIWHTVWDTPTDADEFETALRDYDARRFGTGLPGTGEECWKTIVTACQVLSGESVWWFYGPDGATVDRLIKSNISASTGMDPAVLWYPGSFFPL